MSFGDWTARLVAVQADGTFTPEFERWLKLLRRLALQTSAANAGLSDALAAAEAAEMQLQPPSSPGGAQLPDVTQTASCAALGDTTWQT